MTKKEIKLLYSYEIPFVCNTYVQLHHTVVRGKAEGESLEEAGLCLRNMRQLPENLLSET